MKALTPVWVSAKAVDDAKAVAAGKRPSWAAPEHAGLKSEGMREMRARVYVGVCACVCVRAELLNVLRCACVYLRMYVCMYVCMYACMYVRVVMCTFVW